MNKQERDELNRKVAAQVLALRQAKYEGGLELADDFIASFKEASKGWFGRSKTLTMGDIIEIIEVGKKSWTGVYKP